MLLNDDTDGNNAGFMLPNQSVLLIVLIPDPRPLTPARHAQRRSLSGVRYRKRGRRPPWWPSCAMPARGSTPAEAVRRYRDELMEKYESDFIPYSFQMPISVAVGKVTADFRLEDVVVLDEPQFRPHVITEISGGVGEIPPADAGELQRPRVRSAAAGTGGVPLRPERARLVSRQPASRSSSPATATTSWPTSTCASC